MTLSEINEIREFAVKKATMYDIKFVEFNSLKAMKTRDLYRSIIELCDNATFKPNDAKLLPCPFCGHKVIMSRFGKSFYAVKCADCGALTSFSPNLTRKECEDFWNNRVKQC